MNEHMISFTTSVGEWWAATPRQYTVKWKKDQQEFRKEHLSLEEVVGYLNAFEQENEFRKKPVVTGIEIVGEF